MRSLVLRHKFTTRACIPPRGAALEIAENAEENPLGHGPNNYILCVLSELCGENII